MMFDVVMMKHSHKMSVSSCISTMLSCDRREAAMNKQDVVTDFLLVIIIIIVDEKVVYSKLA